MVCAAVNERRITSTVIVSGVEDVQPYKDAFAFDLNDRILRIPQSFLNFVVRSMEIECLTRDSRVLYGVSQCDARRIICISKHNASSEMKWHREVASHLARLRLHRSVRKVSEEVFERCAYAWARLTIPIDLKLQVGRYVSTKAQLTYDSGALYCELAGPG